MAHEQHEVGISGHRQLLYCGLNISWSTLKDQCRCVTANINVCMPVCASLRTRGDNNFVCKKRESDAGLYSATLPL